jgi:hypothetical protein
MAKAQLKEKYLYRDIVRGAFEVAWQRREFWVLGLLASLLMMNGGAFEFITRAIYKISSGQPYSGFTTGAQAVLNALFTNDVATQMNIFFSIVLFLAFYALVAIAAVAASGGLLQAVAKRALKKKQTVGAAFAVGAAKVGPLLLTQVIGRLVIFVAFVMAALGVYASIDGTSGYLIGVVLFVIFSLVALVVSFLMMMTNAGIMIENDRWMNACHNAFIFLKRHWLVSFEMIGIVFLSALAAGAAMLIAIAVIAAPCILMVLALSALNLPIVTDIVVAIFGLIGVAAAIALGSMLAVFEHAAWALLYTRLADRNAIAKLERIWSMVRNIKSHVRALGR